MRALCLSVAISAAASFVQDVPAAGDEPGPRADPFLKIDGEEVGYDEFGRWLLATQGERKATDFAMRHWLIAREARRLGLEISSEEVARAVEAQFRERITGAFLGSREEWLAELTRTGRTESGARRQRQTELRPELEARAIAALDRVVPEHLIEREWELRHGRKGRRYDLRMMQFRVVVPSPADASKEQWEEGRKKVMEEGREKARAARERALAGEDFGALAALLSDDADTRARRGSPSGGFRHVGWPAVFLDALERVRPGEILEPTYARGGWWIAELRSVDVTPLESVRREIEADLVARGPEPYEIGTVQQRLAEGASVEVLAGMHAGAEGSNGREGLEAFDPVLRIEGEPVTRGEYASWLFDALGESLIGRFTEEWLVHRAARAKGIEADEEEVARRVREHVQALVDSGYHGDRAAWVAHLARGGRREEGFLRQIEHARRIDLLTERLLVAERKIGPAEVRARYAELFGAEGRCVEVRRIRLPIRAPDPPPEVTREELDRLMAEASSEIRLRAEAFVARARAGEDFAALARSASEDPATRELGGALPGCFRPDQWPEKVSASVLALGAGEVGDPQLIGRDWSIFQVVSTRSVSFEEVAKDLEAELRARRPAPAELAVHRNVLRQRARVEVMPAMQR